MTLPASYVQFAVYETFAPTTLRAKVVLVAAADEMWATGLPSVLAMECARIGAHLALAADTPVHSDIARDIVAYGRPVLEIVNTPASQIPGAATERYERVDVVVYVGSDTALVEAACAVMAKQGTGCVVWIAPEAAAEAVADRVPALQAQLGMTGVRVNGIVAPLPDGPETGPSAQELAWQAIFLASAGGAGIGGHCFHPVATPARD